MCYTEPVPEKKVPDWWNCSVGDRSKEIWTPSDQDMSFPVHSKKLEGKSWFMLNNIVELMTTTNKSIEQSISLAASVLGKKPNSVMKVRLYPTKPQKKLLNKMFGTHRAIYNKIVELLREDCYTLSPEDLDTKYRPISQKHSLIKYLPEYHLEVPEEVMNSTFRDYKKALKSSIDSFKAPKKKAKKEKTEKKISFPELKFKSRKDNSSSIEIQSRGVKSINGFVRFAPTYFKFPENKGIKIKEKLPQLKFAVRLQRTRDEKFYLCIPRVKEFEQTLSSRVCAIDPGVRSFVTMYDPEGMTLGVDDAKDKIFQKCLTIDRLISRRTKETSKRKRYRMRKRVYKIFQRMKAMIEDMHQKVSSWLSKNYKEVLLPTFGTSDMTSKQKRISSKTSRAMLTWSHYKFKKMLDYKMERSGGRMIECREDFTTKTCSQCGRINYTIERQKVFKCSYCKFVLDRDVNAARNIFLMNEHLLTWAPRVQVPEVPPPKVSGALSSLRVSTQVDS